MLLSIVMLSIGVIIGLPSSLLFPNSIILAISIFVWWLVATIIFILAILFTPSRNEKYPEWGVLIYQNNKRSNKINTLLIYGLSLAFIFISLIIIPPINHLIMNQPINNSYEKTIASILGMIIGISLLLRGNPGIPLKVYSKGILLSTNPIRLLFNKPLFIPFDEIKKLTGSYQFHMISILSDNTQAIIRMSDIDNVDKFIKAIQPHLKVQIIYDSSPKLAKLHNRYKHH